MRDEQKANEQLIDELDKMRRRIDELEASEYKWKQAEVELKESKEILEDVTQGITESILLLSKDYKILWANKTAIQQSGIPLDEIVGKSCFKVTHRLERPCEAPDDPCPVRELIATSIPIKDEHIHLDAKGNSVFVEVSAYPVRNEKGEITKFVHIAKDITERKQAEEKLKEAYKELEAFSFSVSHDLRAPLRHLTGFAELLRKRLEGLHDEKAEQYIASITGASRKMETLIGDVLDFSRMGRSEMQKIKVNFSALARETVEDIAEEFKGRDIEWIIGELPEVYGDQSMLKLVLNNLLYNAVKFTGTRPHGRIEIGCKDEGSEFLFFVKDNGVGFDMEHADRLFGIFQRLHTEDEFEGTGIGLANVKRIIQRHSGRVWSESSEGKGATFYFTLPKKEEI